jgi:hypothetical protein
LTRFNFGVYDRKDAEKWMKDRIKLFERTKESVLTQTADFKWVLSFDPKTPDEVIEEICIDDRIIPVKVDIRQAFNEIEVTTEFVITSRLDNDDYYEVGAIRKIQDAFQPQLYVIDIDYKQWDSVNGDFYTSGNKRKKEKYRVLPNSPFLSLVEPSVDIYTCYCRPHNKLADGYPVGGGKKIARTKITEQLAVMVIHNKNMMNKITGYKI